MRHEQRAPDDQTSLALRGSRKAWDALVAQHGHAVLVALVARGLAPDRARDLAQAAWMRLIEQQRAGRLESLTLPGLVIAQAGYLALEEARKPGEGHLALDGASQIPDGASDPEARALGREQLERARRELASCPHSAQEVFGLAYGGTGLPHAEIARKTGLSLQRVRQTLCELRQKLRLAIEEQDHD
ncbi:MAG: sigma-70 family RNA polymerase sigma factor [Deltaproteobacteria bacterium]|nr:sigma-70 family RNA polymerase sigma factor [Deltaproteobacteria bacterium]